MMKFRHIAAALMGALAIAGQASAATFNGASGATVTDWSQGSLLAFDIDFSSRAPVTLSFTLDAADLAAGQLSFNSLVRNLSGLGFDHVTVSLNGLSFASAGTITTDGFVNVVSSGSNASAAWANFGPALTSEFYIGSPLGAPGTSDWVLSLAGRQVGDTFSVTVAVPEAESYAMAVAGLAVLGLAMRRRKA